MEGYFSVESKSRSYKKFAILGAVAVIGTILAVATFSNTQRSPALAQFELEVEEFQNWQLFYNKQYLTEAEYNHRFNIFKDNSAYYRVFNSLGNSWYLGHNQFSDLTTEEFKAMLLRPFDQNYERNVKWIENLEIPAAVDWVAAGAVTSIVNQGNCGSCWAFSAIGAIEGVWKISGHALVQLSQQQLLDCAINNGCTGGGIMSNGFKYAIANGITSSANYPYTAVKGSCNTSKAASKIATIRNYADITPNSSSQLYNAVAQQPVAVAVDASLWQGYKGGIVVGGCGTNLNHGVLVVGYNKSYSTPYWKVKNSWGTLWGDAGYIYLAVIDGLGVCGVQMMPSIPIF